MGSQWLAITNMFPTGSSSSRQFQELVVELYGFNNMIKNLKKSF